MGLAINTIVILVILLVLVLVVLILVSRSGRNFTDLGEDKIDTSGDVTNCEILCWECCHGDKSACDDYIIPNRNCGCKKDLSGC